MPILRRQSDDVVTHAGEFQALADGSYQRVGGPVLSATSATHDLLAVEPPIPWSGNWYTYDGTTWLWRDSQTKAEQLAVAVDWALNRLDSELAQKLKEGVSYTFPDGTTGTVPISIPDDASRLTPLYLRAERAARAGETMTFVVTDQEGVSHDLSVSEMLGWGDTFITSGMARYKEWRDNKDEILSLDDPRDVYAFEPRWTD